MKDRWSRKESGAVGLPKPIEGITDEILLELASDRNKFIKETLKKVQSENPAITPLVHECLISTEPDSSLNWMLVYYAIFSRSASKKRESMLQITKDKIDALYSERSRALEQILSLQDEGTAREFYLGREKRIGLIVKMDVEESLELNQFWVLVKQYMLNKTMSGKNLLEIEYTLEPLHELALLFYEQENANKLGRRFTFK